VVPELKDVPPGPQWLRVGIERLFVDTFPVQHKGLQQVLREFPANLVVGDDCFSACCRRYSASARNGPHCALRQIGFALAP